MKLWFNHSNNLDDFFGAESCQYAQAAYTRLQELLSELVLCTSPEKNVEPSTEMLCLGILVSTTNLTLTVPAFRIDESQCLLSQKKNNCNPFWESYLTLLLVLSLCQG